MSWKLKIALGISLLWMSFWFYVYYVIFAQDSRALVIFICGNPVLLGVIWGLYFCFKKKKLVNPGKQNLIHNITHPPIIGSFKNPIVLSNSYIMAWIFFLMLVFVFAIVQPLNKEVSKIVLGVLYVLIDFVIYLLWAYRANKNVHLLGASQVSYSPKEAVLWLAVPMMAIIGNYYVIKELWKASKNPVASIWQSEKNPFIVKLRWLLMILVIVMVPYLENPPGIIGAVYCIFLATYITLSIVIVSKISRMQRLHYNGLNFDIIDQKTH
jgi:hypothetical protein